jgi:hypothetical protein
LKEVLGPLELEVNDLPDSVTVVEIDVILIFDKEDVSEMVVVEVYLGIFLFLDASDLVSNDDFLKVDCGVLNFNVLLLSLSHL